MIGFTGTQQGLAPFQWCALKLLLAESTILNSHLTNPEFRHGQCVGADEQAAQIAADLGYTVVSYPGVSIYGKSWKRSAFAGNTVTLPEEHFLTRNRRIVDDSQYLIACPKEFKEQSRSGTWYTVRYAKKTGKRVILVYPDGLKESF